MKAKIVFWIGFFLLIATSAATAETQDLVASRNFRMGMNPRIELNWASRISPLYKLGSLNLSGFSLPQPSLPAREDRLPVLEDRLPILPRFPSRVEFQLTMQYSSSKLALPEFSTSLNLRLDFFQNPYRAKWYTSPR